MESSHAAQKVVVSIQALGWLAPGSLDLGLLQLRRDSADDTDSHLVLQIENVFEWSLESVCPQMRPGRGINELSADPDSAPGFADAAFKDIANPQLTTDLLHVHGPTLVRKTGVPGDDEEPAHPG